MNRLWSIILAGGEGERLRPFVERWLGCHKPKQYCAFVGTRSMFQHTLDRADRVALPEHRVTVIARDHLIDCRAQLNDRNRGIIVEQPLNCDTAAGVFLPLTYVRAHDPTATVLIYPSDHFVHPEERFTHVLRAAVLAAECLENRLIMLGVAPDTMELDYGWIHSGREIGCLEGHSVRTVEAFHRC